MPTPSPFWLKLPQGGQEPDSDRRLEQSWKDLPTGYTLIQRQVITTPVPNVTFSNLPLPISPRYCWNKYVIDFTASVAGGADANLNIRFNGDNGLNYISYLLFGSNGSSPWSISYTNPTNASICGICDSTGAFGRNFSHIEIHHPTTGAAPGRAWQFTSNSFGAANNYFYTGGGWWAQGSANSPIQSITLVTGVNFTTGQASLYGVV
jgi:hypothetical protein